MPGALTGAIVESAPMRVTRHPYAIARWGVGELWLGDGRVVLAHDPPAARAAAATAAVRTPRGTPGAPTDTLPAQHSRVCDAFVTALPLGRALVGGRRGC